MHERDVYTTTPQDAALRLRAKESGWEPDDTPKAFDLAPTVSEGKAAAEAAMLRLMLDHDGVTAVVVVIRDDSDVVLHVQCPSALELENAVSTLKRTPHEWAHASEGAVWVRCGEWPNPWGTPEKQIPPF